LKGLTIGGSAITLAQWAKPVVETVILPAHAQTSPPDEPECNSRTLNFNVSADVGTAANMVVELEDSNGATIGNDTVPYDGNGNFSGIMRTPGGCPGGSWDFSGTVTPGFPGTGEVQITVSGCVEDCWDGPSTSGGLSPGGGFSCCLSGQGSIPKISDTGGFGGDYSGTIVLTETCGENGANCLD
jgi:hypothetical protein